jgi:hypothetical protein
MSVNREQQIAKAARLIFEAYNMPRDHYPDDYSYSMFIAGKVREAHGVMQCVRGVATWSADNCVTPAPAPVAVAVEPVALSSEQIAKVAHEAIGYDGTGFQEVHSGDLRWFAQCILRAAQLATPTVAASSAAEPSGESEL